MSKNKAKAPVSTGNTTDEEENAPLLGGGGVNNNSNEASSSSRYYAGRIYNPDLDEELLYTLRRSRSRPFWRALKLLTPLVIFLSGIILLLTLLRVDELQEEFTQVPQVKIEGIALDGVTKEGLDVRIQGTSHMDYESHIKGSVRSKVVKLGARLVKSLTISDRSRVKVYFEDEDNEYLRAVNAQIPGINVDISPGSNTNFDFVTKLYKFGSPYLLGTIAERLLSQEPLKFRGVGQVGISKGFLNLGLFPIEINDIVASPGGGGDGDSGKMNLKIGDLKLDQHSNSEQNIDLSTYIQADYKYPVEADVPELNWKVKIPGCSTDDINSALTVCKCKTDKTHLKPYSSVNISASSGLSTVPTELTEPCDIGQKSPLDNFISRYFKGLPNDIVITGDDEQSADIPDWFSEILKGINFTFQFNGKKEDDEIIKDIAFRDFRLHMFDMKEGDSNNNPRVSAVVTVIIETPQTIDIGSEVPLSVANAKGVADLFSKQHKKFAEINIPDWVPCKTTMTGKNTYKVEFAIENSPVNVTDESVFSQVMRQVVFRGSSPVRIESLIDAQVHTPVGDFELTEISANGNTVLKRDS